ncbi:TfuA-like protein [Roseobacter sp.]|uniref:TfuA-like protein n=1 Tax=Roseobacter sp. TaxID=1907202 RepID=UPI0032998321
MIVVFAGPTLGAASVRDVVQHADVRPPARAGDIYAACQQGATAIGLIDGFFDGVPSVWHKEILWALDRGIAVFGASSMGALRAAELHEFGMIGIGAIFAAYRDGTLEDDDEVALRHGPAELGYIALSDPMVNIRASLDAAVTDGIVPHETAQALIDHAKELHFADRSWDRLLAASVAPKTPVLKTWLKTNAVDQKKRDAIEMLTAMVAAPDHHAAPTFAFQHTAMWQALVHHAADAPVDRAVLLILDQLRHTPGRYQPLRRQAADALKLEHLPDVMQADVERAMTQFRAQRQLYTARALQDWLTAQDMDLPDLYDDIAIDLRLSAIIAENRAAFLHALMDTLKAQGTYADLQTEAQHMAATLDKDAASGGTDIPPGMLPVWYFETFCARAMPPDLEAFLGQNDFADHAEFEQMMARTYILWQHQPHGD